LVQYKDEKGQQISSIEQFPEDNSMFYNMYYHNHRTLNHGNLTGMIFLFQCSESWTMLKKPSSAFFQWL
jgi:hypothetical protein